jgi:hemophore-related protein
MKRITAVATLGSAGVLALGLAMPALADAAGSSGSPASSSKSTAAPLTSAQQDAILDFLADHPQLAQGLASRAQGWAKFVAANPAVKAELDKVAALPADQRRAELQKWLAANPAAKKALQTYRQGIREQRLTKQRDRLDRRIKRLQGGSGAGSSPASPAAPSVFTTT